MNDDEERAAQDRATADFLREILGRVCDLYDIEILTPSETGSGAQVVMGDGPWEALVDRAAQVGMSPEEFIVMETTAEMNRMREALPGFDGNP